MKKHNVKRFLCLLLACMMLFQTPLAALADGMGFEEFIILDDETAEDGGLVFDEPAEKVSEGNLSSGTEEVLDFGDELIIDEGFMEEEVSDMDSGEVTETEAETEVETELSSEAESEVVTEVETEEDLLIEEVIQEEAAELAATERTASPASGSGTQADPYVITAADQLPTAILENEWYALGANLTLGADQQITALSGVLDGRGHVVTLNGSALAGTVSGTIRNIGVAGSVSISSDDDTGSVALTLTGTIENSYSTANVSTTGWGYMGGLVGALQAGAVVKNCYYTGTDGYSKGGFAAKASDSTGSATISNSYSLQVEKIVYVGTCWTGTNTGQKDETTFKSEEMVTLLNTDISDTGYVFAYSEGSYPILTAKSNAPVEPDEPAETIIASGDCSDAGENQVTWKLTDTGVLTISGNGPMLSTNGHGQIGWTSYKEQITSVVIEEGVTSIGEYAFSADAPEDGGYTFTSITIPDTVTSIGEYAFKYAGITEINLPSSITSIGQWAFSYTALQNIAVPSGVTTIDKYVFAGCSALTTVSIPVSVTAIEKYAFRYCDALTSILYAGTKAQWDTITIGSSGNDVVTKEKVTYAGDAEEPAEVPVTVTVNGEAVEVTSLGERNYMSGPSDWDAWYTKPVYTVKVPANTAFVIAETGADGDSRYFAMADGQSLDGNVPYTMSSDYLNTYYIVSADELAKRVGTDTGLDTNHNIAFIEVKDGNYERLYLLLAELIPEVKTEYTVTLPNEEGYTAEAAEGSSTTVEAGGSFRFTVTVVDGYDSSNMVVKAGETVLTADESGVYTIADIAADVAVTVEGVTKTETIQLPISAETLDGEALTVKENGTETVRETAVPVLEITIPSGTTHVKVVLTGEYEVYDCDGYFDEDASNLSTTPSWGNFYTLTKDYGRTIDYVIKFAKPEYTVTLPTGEGYTAEAAEGSSTTVEAGRSFSFTVTVAEGYDGSVMEVKAGETVLTAAEGVYTIENITANVEVTVEGLKKAAASGDCGSDDANVLKWTLSDTGVLTITGNGTMVDYRNATNVPWYEYRASIQSVVIGEGVTSVGKYAFGATSAANGYTFTTVTLPGTLTAIGQYAFKYAGGLSEIMLPAGLTSIGKYAFQYCTALSAVTVPAGVTTIASYVFDGCSGLTSVALPAGLTTIANYAFRNCTNLTSVFFAGTEEQWSKVSIGSSYNTALNEANIFCGATGAGTPETAPTITKQPVGGTFEYHDEKAANALSVEAQAAEGAQLSYKWYKNTENSTDGGTEYAAGQVCTPDTAAIGTAYYYCKVFQVLDGLATVTVSDAAEIIIQASGLEGNGTASHPYLLSDSEDMQYLYECVAAGNSMEGIYFQMISDIILPAEWASIGTLKPGATKTGNGTNINPFSGIFDGNNHKLTFAYGSQPLFGYVREATVKNLKIYGRYIAEDGLVANYTVDNGGDGNANTGTGGSVTAGIPDTIDISNVTIKSGTSILGSGFISGYASGSNVVNISDCVVESGVKIGWNAKEGASAGATCVGSFGGDFNGTITNCSSAATVYGNRYVGGIVGGKGQTMGPYVITNSSFSGMVAASGDFAGGIAGGGYAGTMWGVGSAGNTPCATVEGCTVTGSVTGTDKVGGILGGEEGSVQCWENGIGYVRNNRFYGTVAATGENAYVGGIIGYMNSLNKHNIIEGNIYISNDGAIKGIGGAKYIDTNAVAESTNTIPCYFSTESGKRTDINQSINKSAHNRTDDPLGADAAKLARATDLITVNFTLLACEPHGANEVHTLADANLPTWIGSTDYEVSAGTTVKELLEKALAANDMTSINPEGNYVEAIVKDGVELAEFTNGPLSGWMYTLNGVHPGLGVAEQTLKNGDVIIFHYTDDYTKDHIHVWDTEWTGNLDSHWHVCTVYGCTMTEISRMDGYAAHSFGGLIEDAETGKGYRECRVCGYTIAEDLKNVNEAIVELPEVENLTIADADKVNEAKAAYEALSKEEQAKIPAEVVSKLEAAETKIAELQKAAEDQEKATTAAGTITSLPAADKLTKADADKVRAARAAYEALTAEQKALVSKEVVAKLEAAEAQIAKLAHVHSWGTGTVTKNATCTAAGVKTFRCGCGETKTEAIPAAGHKYGAWKTSKKATVWAAEEQTRSCTVCKETDPKTNIVGKKLTPVLEVPGKLSSFNIKKGKTVKFALTMANGDSISAVSSSKTKYLKVSAVDKKTGKITLKGVKKGTSKLTIKLASGKSRTYTVKVVSGTVRTSSLSVTSVTNKKLTLAAKKSHSLKYELKPFTTTQKVTYKSSNKKIAKVTSGGKITAVAPGKATITVSSGSKKVKIVVTVPGITNVKSSVSVKRKKTLTLKPKTYGISGKVTYSSDNTAVATVDSKGKIKGIKKGTAKITVKAGNFTKTVTVKVK